MWPGSTARMKPRAGAKKRKFSEWPESESSSKVIEFRNILYNNSPGVEFSLVNRIAIAKSLSPPPVVYDLDWNPMPGSCKGKSATAMLACASSYGAHIYYYPRTTKTWTTVVMTNRPSRKGECIRWHATGRILATTSNPTPETYVNVTIFSYDSNKLYFDAKDFHEFLEDNSKVSSLAWITGAEILVCAIFPSSCLIFFELKAGGSITLEHEVRCDGFPTDSKVVLQPHPSTNTFFAACEDATKILVWSKQEDSDSTWTIIRNVDCEKGVIGMQFTISTWSLITIQKGHWNIW